MPAGIAPAYVPDYGPPEDPDDALSHLVAISMDPKGFPIKLFTTNRWLTGVIWYAGGDVCRLLPYFAIDHAQPSWPVNVWITNMLVLFRPQIRQLVEARDVVVETWERSHPSSNVFEDRGDISLSPDDAILAGSLFLGVDTLLGPIYMGFGHAEGGENSVYLFLGRVF